METGDFYIGVTVMLGKAWKKTMESRWKKHQYKALVLNEPWQFPAAIRKHGSSAFGLKVLEIVRGKYPAFAREAELINANRPTYNTRIKSLK
jgi:hypothetical protein